MNRDDFKEGVKRTVAARAGHRCSNPTCRAFTSGPQIDATKSLNIGVTAHITAASPNGPRYDSGLSEDDRKHGSNAIWLCQTCGKLVDNDAELFTEGTLRAWKEQAESNAHDLVGKTANSEDTVTKLFLSDQRFTTVMGHYAISGSPKPIIDTFDDLSKEEKAILYDKAVMFKKGRKSKNNPFL